MRTASTGVRPVSLELGGKNASLVFADCDMDKTIKGMTRAPYTLSTNLLHPREP